MTMNHSHVRSTIAQIYHEQAGTLNDASARYKIGRAIIEALPKVVLTIYCDDQNNPPYVVESGLLALRVHYREGNGRTYFWDSLMYDNRPIANWRPHKKPV